MDLKGRVAVITGSGRGIGRAIALAFARHGSHVVINDLLEKEGRETASEAEKLGVKSIFIRADISVEKEVREMFSTIKKIFNRLDILVNNAGVNNPFLVENMPYEAWKRVIDIDLNGAFLCSREAIPEMKKNHFGRIINISSTAGKRISITGSAAYSAAKAGLIGLTRHLAFELASYGITVNAICPGGTLTPRIRERDKDLSEEEREIELQRFPLGRWGLPEDVAKAALFFVSDQADFITGQALDVDGGMLLAWMSCESYLQRHKHFVEKTPGK